MVIMLSLDARIRLLHRPSADHMRYTLHTVCGRLSERVHRASQNPHNRVSSRQDQEESRFLRGFSFQIRSNDI